jgi:hypothetical protein
MRQRGSQPASGSNGTVNAAIHSRFIGPRTNSSAIKA